MSVDPDAFIAHFTGWLEITAFITAQRAALARTPDDGLTPILSDDQLKRDDVQNVGNDAIFAIRMTAAMKGGGGQGRSRFGGELGKDFPGSSGLWHFRATIENPATLEDFVGQAGKKLLLEDIPPPPLRAKENRSTGLACSRRRANPISSTRSCPPAKWTRQRWTKTREKGSGLSPAYRGQGSRLARDPGAHPQRPALYRQLAPEARAPRGISSKTTNTRDSCGRWRAGSNDNVQQVCKVETIAAGGTRIVIADVHVIVRAWPANGAIKAFQGVCPHSNMPLAEAEFDGTVLTSRSHPWT